MRVIGGRLGGRRLLGPGDRSVRPTSDRMRQALFDILTHGLEGFDLEGIDVLDLFAGTGALGIEALSRGARSCLFVEEAAEARGLVRDNLEALGLEGQARIFRRDATRLGPAGRYGPFGLVLADPPYRRGLGVAALASARDGGWFAPRAIAVLEEAADIAIEPPKGFVLRDERTHGEGRILIFSLDGD